MFSPASIAGIRPDQYIFDIKKDSCGDIWSGGYYHLKRINPETKSVRLYPGVSSITTILEKDARQMWIGTRMGLYQLDKKSGVYQYIDLPIESLYICALYQRETASCILVPVEPDFLFMIAMKEIYSSVSG